MAALKNLTGMKFNSLTVVKRGLRPENSKDAHAFWECQCECGEVITLPSSSIQLGRTKSCGCLNSKWKSEIATKEIIPGTMFGKWTVLEKVDIITGTGALWLCQCECGELLNIKGGSLRAGATTQRRRCAQGTSKGEEAINNILIENNIAFKREFSFDDFPGFKFDFFVNNQFIIEFDGTQHYIEKGHFKKSFKDIVNRDIKKNRYCLDNNIKLYRIPYEYRDKLTLEMLTLDKFRVKKEDHYKLLSEVD